MDITQDSVAREVGHWFFSEYLATWATIGATSASPEGVLDYWGVPMHAASARLNRWLMTQEAVLGLLEANHAPLKAAGYTHSAVIDRSITAYNENAVAIDVIWSRRRADDSEIERLATHFEIHRTDDGWRVIALASTPTSKSSLADVWPRTTGPSAAA
ncbi:DUF6841 family protein [Streptomyces sp. NPDC004393]